MVNGNYPSQRIFGSKDKSAKPVEGGRAPSDVVTYLVSTRGRGLIQSRPVRLPARRSRTVSSANAEFK